MGPAARADDSSGPGVITRPDWETQPTAEDMARFYPMIARTLALEGRATISCLVNVKGQLTDCAVVYEAPLDVGFGSAALQASTIFKMRPMSIDRRAVEGGTVRIPLNFQIPERGPAPAWPKPKADLRALALARQIQAARAAYDTPFLMPGALRETYREFGVTPPSAGAEPRAVDLAIQAFANTIAAGRNEVLARHYAGSETVESLRLELAFFQGPAYRAWAVARADNAARERGWLDAAVARGAKATSEALCGVKCVPSSIPAIPPTPPDVDLAKIEALKRMYANAPNGFNRALVAPAIYRALDRSLIADVTPEARAKLDAAIDIGVAIVRDEMREMSLMGYARQMSLDEITEVAAQFELAARRERAADKSKRDGEQAELLPYVVADAARVAHDVFCRATTCVTTPPPAR